MYTASAAGLHEYISAARSVRTATQDDLRNFHRISKDELIMGFLSKYDHRQRIIVHKQKQHDIRKTHTHEQHVVQKWKLETSVREGVLRGWNVQTNTAHTPQA